MAIVAFSLAYAAAGARFGASAGIGTAALAYLVVGLLMRPLLETTTWLVLGLVVVSVAAGLRLLPRGGQRRPSFSHPWWDLPARMAIATALVVGLTAIAPVLGPHTSGLVATFPVYVAVMAVFSQRHQGLAAAIDLLRGLLAGLFGTATFYAVIHVTIVPVGIAPGFLLATAITSRDPGTRASLGPRHVAGPDRARARLTSHVGGERCPTMQRGAAARPCFAGVSP